MKVFFLWSLLIIIASTFFLKIQRESINETSAIFKKRHSGINFIQLLLKEGDSEKSNSSPEETNSTETESDNQTNSDNETEEVDYDILDNENYGEEVKDMRNSISQSGNRTIDKIKENTERLKQKIDNVTHALEDKINNFTERIINKSKELDKLMLFNELKLLKLAVQILKSQVNEIISEIFRLKNLLAKLLENFPSSIKTICNLYKSCGDCLRNKYCGWCQEQEKCMLGDDKGPRFDLCQFYAYEKCEANNCLKYLNCSSCLEDPFCGWCVDEERNLEGCIPGLQDFGSCPVWYYSTFTEKPKCPKPLKKESILEKEEINFENIPEEQRKSLLQREVEIIKMDEKIDEVAKSLEGLDVRISFYEKKYHDVNGKIDIEEINEIRDHINLQRIQEEVVSKMKEEKVKMLKKKKMQANSTLNANETNLADQENANNTSKSETEFDFTSLNLDDPEALKALGESSF